MTPEIITQLGLFDNLDKREHPLLVAEKWAFELQHYERRESEGGNLYSVQDWIAGIGSASSRQAADMWRKMATAELKSIVQTLPYTASNKRVYQMDYTDQQGCYLIAGEMRVTKDRPQLEEIKRYLANAGVLVDAIRRETEGGNLFIQTRAKGIEHRKELTETARDTHVTGEPDYAGITNTTYRGLFGASKGELVKALSLTPAQARRFRDNLSDLGIRAIDSAEAIARLKMQQMNRKLSSVEQVEIVDRAVKMVAPGFIEAAEWVGVDLASGRNLIS
jgi:hypothetical protein